MSERYFNKFGFDVVVSLKDISMSTEEGFVTFTPAEVEKVSSVLSMAGSVGESNKVPFITNSPFRVIFDNEKMILVKKGQKKGEGLRFKGGQIDRLVQLVSAAVGVHVDIQVHRTGASAQVTSNALSQPDPIIDGR